MHVGTFLISVQESTVTPVEETDKRTANRKDAAMLARCRQCLLATLAGDFVVTAASARYTST
jgi:hypothetical protein